MGMTDAGDPIATLVRAALNTEAFESADVSQPLA